MAVVAVLGGGISGLSCAYYLKTLGKSKIKYLFLLEKAPKFGGWIQTTKFPDGAIFEHGPRTLRLQSESGFNALNLAGELNLSSEIIPIQKDHPASLHRLILVKGCLYNIPNSLKYILRAVPPFTKSLYPSILKDLRTPKTSNADETVNDFAERRFGKEVADYIFNPMCRGTVAGDSCEISIRSLMPKIFEADQNFNSVTKGFFYSLKNDAKKFLRSDLVIKAHNELWRMWGLKSGLGKLIDTLACAVEERGFADLHFNAECTNLVFKNNKATVIVDGEAIEVDHIFAAIPSFKLAELMNSYPLLKETLETIDTVTVAVVYLEYDGFAHKYDAFGFLTPSFEGSKVLGIIFDSCCFPEQNGMSRTRLTCMMGGKWFKSLFGEPDFVTKEYLLDVAINEAKKYLHTTIEPVRHRVEIHKSCIPQFVVGHHKKLSVIAEQIQNHNLCLSPIGASYKGAGVPDCVYNAKKSVERYLEQIK